MPRIAASLAVLITAVTCIGFNTARYPAVWHMVGGSDGLASSDPADYPAATTQSAAAPQPESLARSEPRAEWETDWQSDRQPDEDPMGSQGRGWESTTREPNSAYASGEHGGSDDAIIASSPGYTGGDLAAADDRHPYAGDEDESAPGERYDRQDRREDKPVKRVAMREPPEPTAWAPETHVSPSRFDPVAPQHEAVNSGGSCLSGGQDASDSDQADACGDEASAPEDDAAVTPTDEPVEAPTSARYASYSLGAYGGASEAYGALSGNAPASSDAKCEDEIAPQSTLVPVKPAEKGAGGGDSLAARPWADSLSLPDHVGIPGTSEVIPLPPVDEVSTVAAPEAPPAGAEDAIRIYPTTGVE